MTDTTPTPADGGASLAGKVAVITGGAGGIGLAISRAFAEHGATVVISDINETAAKSAAESVPGATGIGCDVRDEASVTDLFEQAARQHGHVDIAVANAGIATLAPITEMPFDQWRELMSINLDGVFLTVKHAARTMLAQQTPGSILTTSSVTALAGVPLLAHYAASKAAVVSITKTAALELRAAGIRVNAILPGFAETELVTTNKSQFEELLGVDFGALIAQGQGGYVQVEDIARLAVHLSDDRAAFCTGGTYVVDGGLTGSLF